MSCWDIAEKASEKEKIKSEFADFINGMNSCGKIDYNVYSQLFDFAMHLFDKMFEHSKYEYENVEEFERVYGRTVNEAFKIGWSMARRKISQVSHQEKKGG